ncbi:hypothetical protein EVAR_49865_1 [Eumeta japonica]|uniref:Zinc finger BED domain-containing protein 4 n=1 Tax=Eumeta variegata TaxID=151549 RepID=A0A4C1XYV3_EUMVA|nr:hypothetical protein EVAR_49865_1 [Eumeta japonica]
MAHHLNEDAIISAFLEDNDSDTDELFLPGSEGDSDHLSIRSESDSEVNISPGGESSSSSSHQFYIGKDGKIKWQKEPPRTNRKGHEDLLNEYAELKPQYSKKRRCESESGNDASTSAKKIKLRQTTLPNISTKSINLDKLIVNFIVDTMSPVSIVENKSFRALIEGAQQLSTPPKIMCRRTCNNKISNTYIEYKENLKQKLKTVDYVCTTADIWSSSKRSYLGMTVHWIDPTTFERNSSPLACRRFKGAHIFDKIAELIIDIHSEYDLRLPKITKTVTDNGSNMVKAFKIFGKPDLPDSECANILNVNEIFDKNNEQSNDDMDEDEMLILKEFPEAKDSDIYQLPNHERCATHLAFNTFSRQSQK